MGLELSLGDKVLPSQNVGDRVNKNERRNQAPSCRNVKYEGSRHDEYDFCRAGDLGTLP